MILKLSQWATGVAPSPTLEVEAKAQALRKQGRRIYSLGTGEPDMDTPEFIKEACIQALRDGKTKYTPVAGIAPLREALAHNYSTRGLSIGPDHVLISSGAKHACYLALLATCQPGDEVLIPAPYWVSYPELVKLTGATPRIIKTQKETGFRLTPDALEAAITQKTKLLILNTPSNPTGIVYSAQELKGFAEVALKHGLYILSDEIYEHLVYDGLEHCILATLSAEVAAHTVTISGFSKSYAMTGWRLGTSVGPAELIKAMTDLQSQTSSNATTFAQYGALATFEHPMQAAQAIVAMRASFDSRRRLVTSLIDTINGLGYTPPEGAFYVFMDIGQLGVSSKVFASKLLEDQGVAVVPGEAFGEDSCVRISYANKIEELQNAMELIAAFVEKNYKPA